MSMICTRKDHRIHRESGWMDCPECGQDLERFWVTFERFLSWGLVAILAALLYVHW